MATKISLPRSVQGVFLKQVTDEFVRQPLQKEEILRLSDIEHLPKNVQAYIIGTGAIGKPRVQNLWLEFDAKMFRKPGDRPMVCDVVQYSFFGTYTRIFFLKAKIFGIPARVLHSYINCNATMWVRIASLFNMVHITGPKLTATETVTVLNDLCAFAPSALVDKRLSWKEIDSQKTEVTLHNDPYKVKALLYFNKQGELINFESDDRPDVAGKPGRQDFKWSTPLRNYKETGILKLNSEGEAIYHYPEGNFSYGTFTLRTIEYNLSGPKER
ncbi:MAG: hypothetical protein NTW10_03285 [Bacteroidetes bacterium]|nr:hypothetical protein [Bacteroidota bacterium]